MPRTEVEARQGFSLVFSMWGSDFRPTPRPPKAFASGLRKRCTRLERCAPFPNVERKMLLNKILKIFHRFADENQNHDYAKR